MKYEDIIENLEEYLNDGMYFYTEPSLGKEECEIFLKLLKEEIKRRCFMCLIKPCTIDYFLENIAEECEEYLVKIKLKYDHEAAYRYEVTTCIYDFDLHAFVWGDDFNEGEQEIYIVDYISFEDVFLD